MYALKKLEFDGQGTNLPVSHVLFLIAGFVFFGLLITAVFFPEVWCSVFTFMDWNGPGAHDDLPFCWTPFQGIIR